MAQTIAAVLALAAPLPVLAGAQAPAITLPAFHEMDAAPDRKQRFFAFLAPLVREENARIRHQRDLLLGLAARRQAGEPLDWVERSHLGWLAREYRLDAVPGGADGLIRALLVRVDVIPLGLVLAQAAKESGWGASRFARHGNNLFGQWCHRPGCGLVPRQRPEGERYEVRRFDSVRDSVASYLRNLNTHAGYRPLRQLRAELRRQSRPLSGVQLAEGLTAYSAEGDAYVREVQRLIRQNDLETDTLSVALLGR